MSTSIDDIPHVAMRELFRTVDLDTLFKCRRVCQAWNHEIESMNYKGTQKLYLRTMLVGVDTDHLTIEGTSKRCYYAHSSKDLVNMLRHFEPPEIFLLHAKNPQNSHMFDELMRGFDSRWCEKVKELEIGDIGQVTPERTCEIVHKFSNIYFLNLIWRAGEFSCSQLLQGFQKLRFLRIYQQPEEHKGLFMDKESLDVLLEHQMKNQRLLQHIELLMTTITFNEEDFLKFLTTLSNIPVHPDVLTSTPDCVNTSSIDDNVYISFLSCHFENPIFTKLEQFCSNKTYSFKLAHTNFNIFVEE